MARNVTRGGAGHGVACVARGAVPVAQDGWTSRVAVRRWGQHRIQTWLRLLVLGCILPSIAMATFFIMHSYQRERTEVQASTLATARALIQAVDRELIGVQSALQGLATSPFLQSGNLAGFHAQALTFLATTGFNNVSLSDASAQQLVNTLKPFGVTLPCQHDPDQVKRVIETGRPVVSDLSVGGVARRPLIRVVVPVQLNGRPVYGLAAGLRPERLGEVLSRQHLPPGWFSAIFDKTGTIVARSRAGDIYVGKKGAPALLRQLGRASEGSLYGVSQDGVAMFTSFSRSELSGWSVVIGIPVVDLTADLQTSLWLSVAVATTLVILGLLWARIIGSRISRPIEALKAPVLALASGCGPELPDSDITEVNEVLAALIGVSQLLDQRLAERVQADTEVQKALDRLTRRTTELERSNADLERFAYITSHDLKAPLRAVQHLVQWISKDVAVTAGPETTANLALLHGRAVRLQALLDGLLAYSRIGRDDLVAEAVDAGTLVRDVVAGLAPPTGFEVVCEGAMPMIRTHRVSLSRVLEHLIGNGLRHHDRIEGRIVVAARYDAGTMEFRVSDDGPGIEKRFHGRIFGIFQTLRSRDELEATGIGLAIVKKKVEGHGGQIRIESAPPARGSVFVFTWKESSS